MKMPLVLAIDTSCDETSASVVEGLTVLSNVLPSQNKFHKKYGGVVPGLAKLAHEKRIDNVVKEALERANKKIEEIEFIAVTKGPGLAIALEVGIKKAKQLATDNNKPLIVVNHMEGHLLSGFAQSKKDVTHARAKTSDHEILKKIFYPENFPALGLLVSGKHTEIILIDQFRSYKIIGETQDDACGEAFDKCGRLLGLGFPAGPVVGKFAYENRKNIKFKVVKDNTSTFVVGTNITTNKEYKLPISMANSGDLNFSYSGLKSAFRRLVDEITGNNSRTLTKEEIYDLCSVFEEAAFKPIEIKLQKAIQSHSPKQIWLGGGVVNSKVLRKKIREICKENNIDLTTPLSKKLTTDNAAMIGVAANLRVMKFVIIENLEKDKHYYESEGIYMTDFERIDRDPSWELAS
jgi:N6-L-threonylcarbamoyladenine synthase